MHGTGLRPLLALALLFALHRLVFLHADPSGPYINMDEGNHNNDARSIILYGSAFYDTYNPSALMPVFTWLKVPFLAVLGINLYGMRIPSILATVGAALLIALRLLKRREGQAALLTLAACGASYLDFCHARIGIQDPILILAAAATLFFADRALESGSPVCYSLAFLCAASAPFVKTSGIFVPAALLLSLAHARFAQGLRPPKQSLAIGIAVTGGFLLLLTVFWFAPHWVYVRRYFMWEVASRRTVDLAASATHLLKALVHAAPLPAALSLLALVRRLHASTAQRGAWDFMDIYLFSWLFCGGAALAYSSLLYWRWVHWLFLPLVGLGARELARLNEKWPAGSREWAPAAMLVLFLGPQLCLDLPGYIRHYREMTFFIWDGTPQVEAIVGDDIVSGSGFDAFAANSSRIHHVSSFDYSHLSSCWEVERAFPSPEKMPRFVSIYAGDDPGRFPQVIDSFYKGCPKWASQYRVFGPIKKLHPRGADMWFVRK